MKVLIVSFRFAPFNSIGSNRVNALVDFFKQNNIEYRVITSYVGIHYDKNFLPDKNISYVSWFDFRKLKKTKKNVFSEINNINQDGKQPPKISLQFKSKLKKILISLLYPDPYIAWAWKAKSVGNHIVKEFKPDVIYSSSYPYSSHIVASYLSKRNRIKWFAELRDPWVANHVKKNNSYLVDLIEKKYSKHILKNATRLVTVSNVWKESLEKYYNVHGLVVRNGYVKNQKTKQSQLLNAEIRKEGIKYILYTGSIFPENQNIDTFMIKFNELAEKNSHFKFCYVGGQVDYLKSLIEKFNLNRDHFVLMGKVSYLESISIQKQADFLLLLNWMNDENKNSKGVIPGKFYEYLGANKPIILWNEGQDNELKSLCMNINKKSHEGKVIIIDDKNTLYPNIVDFNFSSDMVVVLEYSRECQFNKLLKELMKNE
ncbi:hypothetical protein [uncultured Nonlabens sp.]|uniref:hypothetical protein n=1 Tax=uncultured Nonlabens sp. TaxID=859306 RepID=UPI0030DB114D|tara:strand:- start:1643 stop:2929 length:1287 start_codon:yes stop_codon:yes gene_type:complete